METTRWSRGLGVSLAALAILMLGLLALPVASWADTPAQGQAPRMVTIPANGSVTLKVRGFCLDFGKPFPTGEMTTKGLADAKIRQALHYAISKGYTDGGPEQVQHAIWFLRDGQWRIENRATPQEVVDNATGANTPNDRGDGVSLTDAVAGGQASVTAKFVAQTADAFYGDGDAEVRNLTGAELKVFMPIGVVFTAGAGGTFQDLVAYEIGVAVVQVQQTPQVTAQPTVTLQPTAEPTITAVVETPTAVIEAPTQAPAPTSTPTAPEPEVSPRAGGGDALLTMLMWLGLAIGASSIVLGLTLRRERA